MARLPETGQPIALLALAGSGLVAGGVLLLLLLEFRSLLELPEAGNRPSRAVRRRARSLGSSRPRAQLCR